MCIIVYEHMHYNFFPDCQITNFHQPIHNGKPSNSYSDSTETPSFIHEYLMYKTYQIRHCPICS